MNEMGISAVACCWLQRPVMTRPPIAPLCTIKCEGAPDQTFLRFRLHARNVIAMSSGLSLELKHRDFSLNVTSLSWNIPQSAL